MSDIYLDNPGGIEKWLNTLSSRDNRLVDAGIALGFRLMQEQLIDYRTQLYEELMNVREANDHDFENQLLARLHTVSSLSQAIEKRLELTNTPF